MILFVCLIMGNWLLLIGIILVLKVVIFVVWLMGYVMNLIGREWVKFFWVILFFIVGLCFIWVMVIIFIYSIVNLVRVGNVDCR